MDPVLNPYSPGAGRPPVALVGRERELRSWDVRLQRIEGRRSAQPVTLYGLRGVGKTVLLTAFAQRAEQREWIVARFEAGSGRTLRESLGEGLHGPLADLARPSAPERLLKALKTALSFKASYDTDGTWSFGLDLTGASGGGADTGILETDVLKLVRDVATATDTGLAVLVDEAQELTGEELAVVAATAHRAGQEGWPVLFALAGLPSLPRLLAEAKSYTERLFTFEPIRHLDESIATAALTEPAAGEEVSWEADAVALIVDRSSGYPYFLQQFGQDVWNTATASPITVADARAGVATGRAALDNGFFRARWDRATPAEKRYLRAMAVDGDDGSQSGAVAERLHRPLTSLGPTRAKLIAKGLIYAPEHGVVAFTVPHMAEFIGRQLEE
ncbi:MAG: ATP-binding protein [Microbacteriaceae bacterium]